MKTNLLLNTLFVVLLAALPLGAASEDSKLSITTRVAPVVVQLGLAGSGLTYNLDRTSFSSVFSRDDYRIQITESATKARSIMRIRIDKTSGGEFTLNGFSIRVMLPKSSFAGAWFPGSDVSSGTMIAADPHHSVSGIADANFGIPYIGAITAKGRTALALGMGHQNMPVVIKGETLSDGSYALELKVTAEIRGTSIDERFYLSNDAISWFDTAANYADWVDAYTGYKQFPIGPTADEPSYDTWYWSGDQVNQDLYLQTAGLAAEVGAKLYLADSGWDAPTGEYNKWLLGKTGNYAPPADKFSNLAQTFEQIRSRFGMGIQLWLQPFAVGRQSDRYASTRTMHIQIPSDFNSVLAWPGVTSSPFTSPLGQNLETVNLCPRLSTTTTYLKNLFSEMATRYNPDGYWLDFIDGMSTFCVAGHRHTYSTFGDGFKRSLDAVKTTILAANPNATVHFRARYANLFTKPYANVWQSEDSPGSYDQMRLNALRLRPFSKGVVFAADQMYWAPGTPDTRVAKFIMTSVMTGVPAFGANLLYASESERTMLKAWLGFYQDHKEDLVKGKFSPWGTSIEMPNHEIEGAGGTYAYVRHPDSSELTASSKTIYLMNATDGASFTVKVRLPAGSLQAYSATTYNRYLVAQPGPMQIMPTGTGLVTFKGTVEEGGIVVLKPAN